jgi:hypothetical protein
MTRSEAIDLLVQRDLAQLSLDKREMLLLDWWSIDANDRDYDSLPDLLKVALARADQTDDPGAPLYDPLLQVALRRSYVGVLNSYLKNQIAILGRGDAVDGDVAELATCPCCGYRSLRERGSYEICRVCFWEDDGTTEPDIVSGPNHMTLREARLNIQRFGAVIEQATAHVLPDGNKRFALAGT